jgi:hypothetical protein
LASARTPVVRQIFEDVDELDWPLDRLAFCVHRILLRACPFWWLIDRREVQNGRKAGDWDIYRAAYVLFWVVALVVMWQLSGSGDGLKVAFVVLAVWRWIEVFTTGLGVVLDQVEQERARSLITIAIYGLQITLVFAILDRLLAASSDSITRHGTQATGAFDFLYISWTDMTTLGNDYSVHSVAARALQMATTTSGVLLLGVLVAVGVNKIARRLDDESPPAGSST